MCTLDFQAPFPKFLYPIVAIRSKHCLGKLQSYAAMEQHYGGMNASEQTMSKILLLLTIRNEVKR